MLGQFGIAVKCLVNQDNRILLLYKTDDEKTGDHLKNNWDLPGGRMRYKEQAVDTIRRELMEETGLKLVKSCLKSTSTVMRSDGLHLQILLFKCICDEGEIVISDEHSFYEWKDIIEIEKDINIPAWIKKSLQFLEDE